MNDRVIQTRDGRIYRCAGCRYHNLERGLCSFCMMKILDDMERPKNEEDEKGASDEQ